MRDKLQTLLARLRFDGRVAALEQELERAEREGTTAPELIYRLLCAEAASQRQRSLAYRLKQARLPWDWTLETFPFQQQPSINRGQIKALAGLDFLSRANNIVLTGKTGTGKTGIAIGILREACLNGYRGRFYDAQDLALRIPCGPHEHAAAQAFEPLAATGHRQDRQSDGEARTSQRLLPPDRSAIQPRVDHHHDVTRADRLVRAVREETPRRCAARPPAAPLHHHQHRRPLVAQP